MYPADKDSNRWKNVYVPSEDYFIPNESIKLQEIEKSERLIGAKSKAFKLMTMIYLNVIQRTAHKEIFIPFYLDLLKSYMNSSVPLSQWFLNQFSNFNIIQEMFFENPNNEVRRFLSGLIYCAMLNVYKQEKKLLMAIFD